MDLLDKIRQKARQEQENRSSDEIASLKSRLSDSYEQYDALTTSQIIIEDKTFDNINADSGHNEIHKISEEFSSTHNFVPTNPLEIILAGRKALNYDEDLPLMSESQLISTHCNFKEFLCFNVADEVYGVDIMNIKELIKPREVTEVPRVPSFVSGIISLRGIIIPVIDLFERLGLERTRSTMYNRVRVIIVMQGTSYCGLLVDDILQVVRVEEIDIEAPSTVFGKIDRDFIAGIARIDSKMIILLNLTNIINFDL